MARVIDGVLSETALLDLAGERAFGRGENSVQYVRGLLVRPGVAEASVQAKRVYVVRLRWGPEGITGECSCRPNTGGDLCAHLVAVGLKVIDSAVPGGGGSSAGSARDSAADAAGGGDAAAASVGPDSGHGEPDAVRAYLAGLDAQELSDLVQELASYSEQATRELELRAAMSQGHSADVGRILTAAVTSALSPRGFIDYRRSFEVGRDIQEVLDEAVRYLELGAADAVRPALLKALTRLRALTQRADDSAGVLGDACRRAADLYARSCREGSPDPVKLATWLVKFRTESPGWPETPLDDYVTAFDDKALTAYRRGIQAWDERTRGAEGSARFGVRQALLELADHDHDIDRAVELLSEEGTPNYPAIVTRLRAGGRLREAMSWVDRGVGARRVTLRTQFIGSYWLDAADVARWYLDEGREEDALAMLRGLFEREPGTASYELLGRIGDELGRGPQERAWAIDTARHHAAQPFGSGALLVQIALRDDDLDGAWAAANEYGAGPAWEELMQASSSDRPYDAAQLYRPLLADLLERANTRRYPQVAKVLKAMGTLYAAAGREDEFAQEVRALREEYRRRPTLIAALDRAKLPR